MPNKDNRNPHAETIDPAEFDKLVKDFYGTRILLIGSDLAQHVLDTYNTANRRLAGGRVQRLVDQLQRGEFRNTGEPIIVSREGILNDGQHRLQAIAESGVTVDQDVRFGIGRETFVATNTGASRSAGDVLHIGGVPSGSTVAQVLRLLLLYERGLPEAVRDFVSHAQVAAAWERWPDIADIVELLSSRSFPKGVKSTPLLCTAFLASRAPGKRKLDAWLETLETGVGDGKQDPAHQLREYLLRGADAGAGTREAMLERWATMLRSWMLYRAGETVTARDLRWKFGRDEFPKLGDAKL